MLRGWFGRSPGKAATTEGASPSDKKRHKVHLGEKENKFYFCEKTKRWRVEGEEDEDEDDGVLNSPPRMGLGTSSAMASTHHHHEHQQNPSWNEGSNASFLHTEGDGSQNMGMEQNHFASSSTNDDGGSL